MKQLEIQNFPRLTFEMTEALNQFRINLGFCGGGIKTIMMTSSTPNEGKTFLTMQLWKMMTEVGSSVVMIDCDLRKSEVRSLYGLKTARKLLGVPHYLSEKAELQDVLYQTNVPNGYMIPAATSVTNPTILLENGRLGQMLEQCAQRFDYVLVDTPPIGTVADGLNIAPRCDGAVLVVHSGETPRKLVDHSLQLLHRTETPLLVIVLNRMDTGRRSQAYYHRYYRSYYSYQSSYAPEGKS